MSDRFQCKRCGMSMLRTRPLYVSDQAEQTKCEFGIVFGYSSEKIWLISKGELPEPSRKAGGK